MALTKIKSSGIDPTTSLTTANLTVTANATVGNISATGFFYANGTAFIGGGGGGGNGYTGSVGYTGSIGYTGSGGGVTLRYSDSFSGNGSQTAFTLSVAPSSTAYTTVVINGITQLRSSYSLSGTTLTFSEAPPNGSTIEVSTTVGSAQVQSYVTRTYTGDGSTVNYTVSAGLTVSQVIVTENGIVQTPTTDYTISGTTLTFTTAPANTNSIQIRELGGITGYTGSAGAGYTGSVGSTGYTGSIGYTGSGSSPGRLYATTMIFGG